MLYENDHYHKSKDLGLTSISLQLIKACILIWEKENICCPAYYTDSWYHIGEKYLINVTWNCRGNLQFWSPVSDWSPESGGKGKH